MSMFVKKKTLEYYSVIHSECSTVFLRYLGCEVSCEVGIGKLEIYTKFKIDELILARGPQLPLHPDLQK